MTIWLHTSNAIKINNRSYFLLLEGFRKKKTMQKKALFRTKKSLIPDTLKSVGGIVPFFYMFFFARNTLREVSKKKEKKHVKNASFGLE
jgi:hypothetical protein